ncbi:MAG TPA: GspH/FimT family pseudopilin [Verrucomicrobiae bacterium]|nr:GspH/FimT family pseudopilin [Verrucomicrobiae bacterium]
MKLRPQSDKWQLTGDRENARPALGSGHASRVAPHASAFTLIELILVMALVVVITSLAAPAMSNFIRGQALDSEARRLLALIHAGQSRAVSEGLPIVLWVDEKQGTYGLQAETTGRNGDPKAENLSVDEHLQIAVVNTGSAGMIRFRGLPAIRFLPDGTVDENSPSTLRLTDARGQVLWLIESHNRNGYEIQNAEK